MRTGVGGGYEYASIKRLDAFVAVHAACEGAEHFPLHARNKVGISFTFCCIPFPSLLSRSTWPQDCDYNNTTLDRQPSWRSRAKNT